jgi:superfamily II DNA/RNA helicase
MLELGFREDLEFILDASPADRRTLLFSATIPRGIAALAKRYQRDALRIAASVEDEPHGDIEYRAIRIAPNESEHAVVNVLRYFEASGALVFCSTREAVKHLYGNLLERGFAAVALSGELTQSERTHALQALRTGRARVCVATDVAARGIDLPALGLVVHADLPNDRETLLHRSGRTGRAGRKGTSVLLVPYTKRRRAERLLEAANVSATWSPPAIGGCDPGAGPGAASERCRAPGRGAHGGGSRRRPRAPRRAERRGDRRRLRPPPPEAPACARRGVRRRWGGARSGRAAGRSSARRRSRRRRHRLVPDERRPQQRR